MSSNLFKANWVVFADDTRIIDSNELAEEKVHRAAALPRRSEPVGERQEGFVGGLDADTVELLVDQDSTDAVLKSTAAEELAAVNEELEAARAELLAVQEEIEQRKEQAQTEIEVLRTKTLQEAREQGHKEGYEQGLRETQAMKTECEAKRGQLEQEYQAQVEALEPEFVEQLTSIYEHIFQVDLCDYRGLVVNLLTDAMQKTDSTGNVIVHTSREDYPEVNGAREELLARTGILPERLEIVSDMTLGAAECMIETEGGVFDCSLGTELKELKRKLTLLSYKGGR